MALMKINIPLQFSTPVNAVNATGTLTLTGLVSDAETVTIGSRIYEFDTNASILYGRVAVTINRPAATLTTALAGTNDDLIYTAKALGTVGNSVSVRYVDPVANNAVLGVTVAGSDITVNLATGVAGAITSTAAQIKTAIDGFVGAAALVTVANAAANNGTGVVTALAKTFLAGGLETVAAATAVTALVTAINSDVDAVVTATAGGGTTVIATAKIAGIISDIISTETITNGAWGGIKLTGGVDGTQVLGAALYFYDNTYLYLAVDGNTTSGKNWRRISIGAAY